jgi:hypothetical protein
MLDEPLTQLASVIGSVRQQLARRRNEPEHGACTD